MVGGDAVKKTNLRCKQQTMDIGVEHFSLTRYIPRTGENKCSHGMVRASRPVDV